MSDQSDKSKPENTMKVDEFNGFCRWIVNHGSERDMSEVITAIRLRRTILNSFAMAECKVGRNVSFPTKKYGIVEGTITKINQKTVLVEPHSPIVPDHFVYPEHLTHLLIVTEMEFKHQRNELAAVVTLNDDGTADINEV